MWAVASSLWDVTSYVHDAQVLCGLLHLLTLTLTQTIIKVQCRARNAGCGYCSRVMVSRYGSVPESVLNEPALLADIVASQLYAPHTVMLLKERVINRNLFSKDRNVFREI